MEQRGRVELLYKEHWQKLCIHAQNLLNDEENARDIVNDVFCTLLEHPEKLREETDPLPYLYMGVRNRCIDYLRHQQVERRNEEQIIKELFGDFTEEEYQEYEERIVRMQQELDRLPPQMRTVLEAFFLHGKHYKEIGEELHISPNTARTHVARAIKALRHWMTLLFF